MIPVKKLAATVCLLAVFALWLALRRQEKEEPFVSLEQAYLAYAEDTQWEGTSSLLFDSVYRSGFKELKECIAREPNVALEFYRTVPDAHAIEFAIAAAEAVGIDARGKAKEVGFEALRDHLMSDFADYVKRTACRAEGRTPDSTR